MIAAGSLCPLLATTEFRRITLTKPSFNNRRSGHFAVSDLVPVLIVIQEETYV
jgi:hypothetical protein